MSYIGKTPTSVPLTSSDITDGIITLPKLTDGTDGNIISYDASGNPVAVATGTDGQVLTSTGAGSPPAFEALPTSSSAGTIGFSANASAQTIADQTFVKITGWTEEFDNGSCWDNSNAKFQPTTAGKYLVYGFIQKELGTNAQLVSTAIYKNGSGYEYAWEHDANFTIGRSTNHLITSVDMNGSSDYLEFYGYANVSSGTVNASGGTFGAMLIK